MKRGSYIVLFFLICYSVAISQIVKPGRTALDSTSYPNSLPGSLPDSLQPAGVVPIDTSIQVPISAQFLDALIEHGATDTQWVDVINNQIHLIGDAFVKYEDNEIKAGYIIFDFIKKEAYAEAVKNKSGKEEGIPTFTTSGTEFRYKRMKFNFETQKGIVYEAFTQQGEFFVHGGVTKFVSKEKDSLFVDDVIFNKDALITSCNHEHPHYGIRASKLKLIPDKLAIIGPSRLEIAGIPTPLFIPFAFMPLIKGQRSGLIFGGQQGFEMSETLGFGFREIGYYWALNDYMDLQIVGDIYSRGSWGLRGKTNYAKRYKYRGSLNLGYSAQFVEREGDLGTRANKSFQFGLSHNQDSKAHPYMTVGGNIRFTTNDFDRNNFNDARSQLENIINSNFRISHQLPGLNAFSLNATISHSQNTRTRKIDFTLPNLELRMKTIYPFKRKSGSGKERWYEKFNMRYNSKFKNFVSTTDTTLFTAETLEKFQTGVSHDAQIGASFNVLKHFQLSPSADYDELWYFKTLEKEYNPDTTVSENILTGRIDSNFTVIDDIFKSGFSAYRNFRTSLNLSTNVFSTVLFKKGRLKGIRHTMKPSIGLSFVPSTERYTEVVRDDIDDEDSFREYTRFDGGIFSVPRPREKQMAMTYSISNLIEGKYFSKKDSTDKKLKILNNINMSGSHNFAADSLKWSTMRMSGSTSLFGRITSVALSASFDPYIERNGRRVNESVWKNADKIYGVIPKLFRLEAFQARVSTSFRVSDILKYFDKRRAEKEEEEEEDEDDFIGFGDDYDSPYDQDRANREFGASDRDLFSDRNKDRRSLLQQGQDIEDEKETDIPEVSFWDILESFSFQHSIVYRIDADNDIKESRISTNSLSLRGAIPLTDSWNIQVGNISYDFVNKRFVYPSLGFSRDLHCWDMFFSWQPQGGTFSFQIKVKSGQLGNFLKYDYGQNQYDRFGRR